MSLQTPAPTIAVAADPMGDVVLQDRARRLADDLSLPAATRIPAASIEFLLTVTDRRLELRVVGGEAVLRGGRPIYVDAARRDVVSAAGARLGQPLLRAVGIRRRRTLRSDPPHIIDATAGWGGDALMLASLGCNVLAMERHAVVARLLLDGVDRAGDAMAARVEIAAGDAGLLLEQLHAAVENDPSALPDAWQRFARPDAVYIDPMFPPRSGNGAESKAMRVLRRLTGPDMDGKTLLAAARRLAPARVVVKRPTRADALGGGAPDATYHGKAMRYDVYFAPGAPT